MQILSESSAISALHLVPQPVSKRAIFFVTGALAMITSDCVSRTKTFLNGMIQISVGSLLRFQFTSFRKLSKKFAAFLGINSDRAGESYSQMCTYVSDTCPLCLSGFLYCVAAACGHRFCGILNEFPSSNLLS